MIQRGRKSSAALTLVGSGTGQVSVVKRPEPPADLSDAECADLAGHVVDSMPADWFRPEQLPVLKQFCRHVATADQVATWKQEAESRMLEDKDAANFDLWLVRARQAVEAAGARVAIDCAARNENADLRNSRLTTSP